MEVPARSPTAAKIVAQAVGFALAASALCLAAVLYISSPEDALAWLWLFVNQPAYWALAFGAAFMNTRTRWRAARVPASVRVPSLVLGIAIVGWVTTYAVLRVLGVVY